jgi:hypothetical protein
MMESYGEIRVTDQRERERVKKEGSKYFYGCDFFLKIEREKKILKFKMLNFFFAVHARDTKILCPAHRAPKFRAVLEENGSNWSHFFFAKTAPITYFYF